MSAFSCVVQPSQILDIILKTPPFKDITREIDFYLLVTACHNRNPQSSS